MICSNCLSIQGIDGGVIETVPSRDRVYRPYYFCYFVMSVNINSVVVQATTTLSDTVVPIRFLWKDIEKLIILSLKKDPIYTNVNYPFRNLPSVIRPQKGFTNEVEVNPVGSYRRNFVVPVDWKDKEIFLHFDGAYSGIYIWVNGEKVGYSQGANNDAEFNITPYIRTGENVLAVEVYRWTDGSYLEDQDMFRLSGIHRDVYLYATPRLHVRDYHLSCRFLNEELTSSEFQMKAMIRNYDRRKSGKQILEIQLLDKFGNVTTCMSQELKPLKPGEEVVIDLNSSVTNPLLWSAEKPDLYTAIIALRNKDGRVTEAMSTKFGFRKVEVRNKRVYINNKQVFFKGVNRHDIHP